MPRSDVKTCRYCGRHASEVGALSWQRMCLDCAHARREANEQAMRDQSGPFYLHWARRWELEARRRRLAAERAAASATPPSSMKGLPDA